MSDSPDPRRWRILAVTLAVGFMVLLDVTIVNVAIPAMRSSLGASSGSIQWVVSGYALTFGLTLVTGGRLGDAWGRRVMMMVGLGGFVAASAAAGLAPTTEVLVGARLVQGVAAGLVTPQNSGLIQSLFSGAERGRAFGYFGLTVSISAGIGPTLGGAIIALLGPESGWRWIFLVNVPLGLVAMVAIWRLVPSGDEKADSDARLDLRGALLLGATVLCVLYPIVAAEGGARWPLLLLGVFPFSAYAFVRWERGLVARGGAPLLDIGLLRRVPGYASGIAIGSLYFTGFTGVLLVLSVYLQEARGYSALTTGLLLTSFAVGSSLSAVAAGRIVTRVGRVLTVWALLVLSGGFIAMALLAPLAETRWELVLLLAVPLLIAGLGGGATVSPNFTLTLAEVPVRMGGAAGGAVQTGQRIGSALGAAAVTTTFYVVAGMTDDAWALRAALLTALIFIGAALAVSVWSWKREGVEAKSEHAPATSA